MTDTGGTDRIEGHFTESWLSIPLALLLDHLIGDTAFRVFCYLMDRSRIKGWELRMHKDVLPRFRISEYRWPRIRNELERAGYYMLESRKGENGTFSQVHHLFYPPRKSKTSVKKPPPSFPGVGDPGVGNSGVYSYGDKSQLLKSSSTRTRACAVPACAGAAATAEKVEKGKQNKAFRKVRGIDCWTAEDQQVAEALLEQHGVDAVESAANAVREAGATPLPGRVAVELQRRVRALQKQAKREEADQQLAQERAAAAEAAARAPTATGQAQLATLRRQLRLAQGAEDGSGN